MKLLSFGELIWDICGEEASVGGAPLNFAAHAALCGADSALLSAVGCDELGEKGIAFAARCGVDTTAVARLPDYPTGTCTVRLDDSGKPTYTLHRQVAYDHIPLPADLLNGRFDLLAFGTLALREEDNRRTLRDLLSRGDFSEIYCDVNIRPPFYDDESIRLCLQNATLLKLSNEDLPAVAVAASVPIGDDLLAVARSLAERFCQLKVVIITLGADGSVAWDARTATAHTCPAHPATVVSTVGAGDSFGAAFVTAYLAGHPLDACLDRGAALSARVVASPYAVCPPDEE